MAFKQWKPKVEITFPKSRIRPTREALKQNNEVPFLGISDDEFRDSQGQLVIKLRNNRLKMWIVIGKYAEPRPDGNQFYLCAKAHSYATTGRTTYHEELLMAVTQAIQIKEEFENADV